MTYVVGVIGAALLSGLFTMLRPSDAACTGHCAGCTRDSACRSKAEPNERVRELE